MYRLRVCRRTSRNTGESDALEPSAATAAAAILLCRERQLCVGRTAPPERWSVSLCFTLALPPRLSRLLTEPQRLLKSLFSCPDPGVPNLDDQRLCDAKRRSRWLHFSGSVRRAPARWGLLTSSSSIRCFLDQKLFTFVPARFCEQTASSRGDPNQTGAVWILHTRVDICWVDSQKIKAVIPSPTARL